MIDSMFLGVFAGMFSCFIAILLNYRWAHDHQDDVDLDRSASLAKTSLYLLATVVICFGAAFEYAIGSLVISINTLFGMFAFVVADELVNSSFVQRLVDRAE